MAIYTSEDFTSTAEPTRRVQAGSLIRVARGVYTDEVNVPVEEVVRLRWFDILAKLFPGAVITYRSGFDYRPDHGALYISHPRSSPLRLPGLTVYPDGRASNRQDDDIPMGKGIFAAAPARALADNTRGRGRPPADGRLLSRTELHDRIARIAAAQPRAMSDRLIAQVEERASSRSAEDIRVFFQAAYGERPTLDSDSPAMQAAVRGESYDHLRVARFRSFAASLENESPVSRRPIDAARAAFVPFYEAYFSNFIEGTEFPVREAEAVVFEHADFGRPRDAHDVRGTYEVVSNTKEMERRYASAEDFMDAIRERHFTMMSQRPDVRPGMWKNRNNRAGATQFVDHTLVSGTLRAGWSIGNEITDPFRRAVYMMFLISEVHPFIDGNGRSARVAMNNELVAEGEERVIIPTVLRLDYLSALTRATADGGPGGLYRVMDFAQNWVSVGDFSSTDTGLEYLELTNALVDARDAERGGYRLVVPRRSVMGGYVWDDEPRRPDPSAPPSAAGPTPFLLDLPMNGDV